MAGDVRIVSQGQNAAGGPVGAEVRDYARGKPLLVALANVSGDVYNALGSAAGGDGAILDGADSGIKATVRNASGSVKPLHVIITNASGDTPNLAPPGGADGAILDGADSAIKGTVRDYTRSNPVAVVLTNSSGDSYNSGLLGSSQALEPVRTTVGTAAAQILPVNNNRRSFIIQNAGTTVLKLLFGTATPTQTSYHAALPSGDKPDAGLGGTWIDDVWRGAVQGISDQAGGIALTTELL
mgnify:CR=1 FL=1